MATETLRPNAGGDETTLSYFLGQGIKAPNPIKNFTCVDEETHDGGYTAVWGIEASYLRDFYNIEDSSVGSGTINNITVYTVCQVAVEGIGLKIAIKSGTGGGNPDTPSESAEKTVTVTWDAYSNTWTTNPATGEPWTWDEIDKLQVGVSLKAPNGYYLLCTQVYVVVDYTTGPIPDSYNKILYTVEPPTPNAWNQVKREVGTGWKKLLYV